MQHGNIRLFGTSAGREQYSTCSTSSQNECRDYSLSTSGFLSSIISPIDTEVGDQAIEKAFGRVVRELRRALGLSQAELAFRIGIHPTYLSQLERGLKSPTLSVISRMADSLGITPGELVARASRQARHSERDVSEDYL